MKLQRFASLSVLCGLSICMTTLGQTPAAGSAEEGQTKSTACIACHGVNGNSANPQWPTLAGQHKPYIAKQLHAFKSGSRKDPLMSPMAVSLSDDDIEDLAAYFSAQKPTGLEADPGKVALGQRLYRGGDTKAGLAACAACHGAEGHGNPARVLSRHPRTACNIPGDAAARVSRRDAQDGSKPDDAHRRKHDVRRADRRALLVRSGLAVNRA